MYQKNKLKDLIYIQENKPCNEQTVKGLFRSIVEPILSKNAESLILCRLEEKSKNDFNGILKRLEYSNAKVYDFSDKPLGGNFENVLKEKVWNNTEFVYVLAERFGAIFIFDYEESDIENFAQFYLLYNSKNLFDSFDIINANSKVDLSKYKEKAHPDRRDNTILNSSIRKIVENLNDSSDEIMISQIEKETDENEIDLTARLEFLSTKSNFIAHEMRNLLSICNLYSEIIDKQSDKISFADENTQKSVLNARDCIKKSLKMTGNLLLDFKSLKSSDLKEYDLKLLLETATGLGRIYANGRNIEFKVEINQTANILVDENKFLAVLINLIKNAVESIDEEKQSSGEILIKTRIEEKCVKISVSNNGTPITKEVQERIFEGGFTTKASGSGLGLAICKKTLEEQFAQLKLVKSNEVSTEFEITVLKG